MATQLPRPPEEPGVYVLRVSRCPTCNGTGVTHNPKWEEVYRLVREEKFTVSQACRVVFGLDDWDEIPPEEANCPVCKGQGVIYTWQKEK